MDIEFQSAPSIIKSDNDLKLYKLCTLSNGIKVLLIHDPDTVKSSAAISVKTGSLQDPDQCPGLAHLVQHMVFMGSKNFPDPQQYTEFISINSGYQNAQTTDETTNYYFQITNSAFEQAIIRTCDFLINPLFTPQCINQQIHAINEEFILAQNDEDNRRDQIIKKFAIKPYQKFNMGNTQTLNHPKVYQLLCQYFQRYYKANNMKIVLYSQVLIEQMEEKLLTYLEQITNNMMDQEKKQFDQFLAKDEKTFLSIESLKEENVLIFVWSIEGLPISARKQLYFYLKYILSHTGQHSLSDILQQLDEGIQCQFQQEDHQSFSIFTLKINLQGEDDEWPKKIYSVVMKYLREKLHFQQQMFEQMRTIQRIKVYQLQVDDMEDYLLQIVSNVDVMPSEQVLSKVNYLYQAIDPQQFEKNIQKCIVNSQKLILIHQCPSSLKHPLKEEFYGTKYKINEKISEKLPKKIPKMKQIRKNPFLPLPREYFFCENSRTRLLPHSNIYFYNQNSESRKKLVGSIKMFVHYDQSFAFWHFFEEFMDILSEDIDEVEYLHAFNVQYNFNYIDGNFYLQMNGISSILLKFLKEIGVKIKQTIKDLSQSDYKDEDLQEMFQDAKQNVLDSLQDFYEEDMDDLAQKIRDKILMKNSLPLSLAQKQIEKIKKGKFFKKFIQLWKQSKLQWIFVGNFDQNYVRNVCKQFQENIGNVCQSIIVKKRQQKILKVPHEIITHQIRLKDDDLPTSTCMVYFQIGRYSQNLQFIARFIENYLDEPYYSQLRTNKKLSYDLQLNVVNTRGILGINFLLVSSKCDPHTIANQINQFLSLWVNEEKMMESFMKNFEKLKNSVLTKYLEITKKNQDLLDFISEEVINRTYAFRKIDHQYLLNALSKIQPLNVVNEAKRIFEKGCIQIFLVSKRHKKQYNMKRPNIKTLQTIKSKYQYYTDHICQFKFADFE